MKLAAIIGVVVAIAIGSSASAQDLSAVEGVRMAVMTTCYPMIAGGDAQAARRSVTSGDLRDGAPHGFPQADLETLLDVPGDSAAIPFHVPVSTGQVLVISAPGAGVCSVAMTGSDGEAVGAEIDVWFNGEPSPFTRLQNTEGPAGWGRVYEGAETPSRPTRILTTTMRDGFRQDVPIRFLATMHRISD